MTTPHDPAVVLAERIFPKTTWPCDDLRLRVANAIREAYAEQTAEVKRLRAMMKRLITATYAGEEWHEAMNAIGYEVTDEVDADEAAEAAKGKSDGNTT